MLYSQPANAAVFDMYCFETQVPIARKFSHLRSMKFNAGPPVALSGTAPHLIAALEFDTMANLQSAMASPEGQAAAANVRNFAEEPTLLVYETRMDG